MIKLILLFAIFFVNFSFCATRTELELECFDLATAAKETIFKWNADIEEYIPHPRLPIERLTKRDIADACIYCTKPQAVAECITHIDLKHSKKPFVGQLCQGAEDSSSYECWSNRISRKRDATSLSTKNINNSLDICSKYDEKEFLLHISKDKTFAHLHPINTHSRKYKVKDEL